MENDQASRTERAREIILDNFLASKHLESGFRETILSEHQDLMPEIELEFQKLEKINAAVHGGSLIDEFSATQDWEKNTMPQSGSVGTVNSNQSGLSSINPSANVPNYQLLRCVGRGGFGEVWLARNVVTEDYHAVKLLAEQCSLEIEGVRRYTEQVRSFKGLVPIKEVGKTDAGYYYVMPLADDVKGGAAIRAIDRYEPKTLAWCYKNQPPMTIDEIMQLGLHLLGVLEDLHETGLTHCDVKPANVIAVAGEWMLCDIGLMTRTDHFPTERGTLDFLPPDRRCDHSADLYALAKTLFLLASGAPISRFEQFVQGDLELQVESTKSDRLRQILGKACHPDADARYSAARDMRNDLNAMSGLNSPNSVSLETNQLPDRDSFRITNWWPILFLIFCAVAISLVGIFGFPFGTSATNVPQQNSPEVREVPDGAFAKVDLEIVKTKVVNLENHDPSKGRTMSHVTIRNNGSSPYDHREGDAQILLKLPHLPGTLTKSWSRTVPSLDAGEEKEILIFNGNFQTDQDKHEPSSAYEVVYQIIFAGDGQDSNEDNNRRTGWYTPATESYVESEALAE